MNKNDLKTGMVVKFKEGHLAVMLNDNTAVSFKGEGGVSKNMMEEDISLGRHSIAEVYTIDQSRSLNADMEFWLQDGNILDYCTLVWKYVEEVEELTLGQVCKELGREIKIIREGN